MKKYISADTATEQTEKKWYEEALAYMSEEELNALPDKFLCYTRVPGGAFGFDNMFAVLSKESYLKAPDKCFFIDSYWGYAYPEDIYLATREDLDRYYKHKLDEIDKQKEKLESDVRRWRSYVTKH